jgi:hypothetical protein
MTTRQTSPCMIVAGIAPSPVAAAPLRRPDLKPTNSIMSAVLTVWDLDVRRRATKRGENGGSERQTNCGPPIPAMSKVRNGGIRCLRSAD